MLRCLPSSSTFGFVCSLQEVHLTEVQDVIVWKFNGSGCYSAASAYSLQMHGRILSLLASLVWPVRIPLKIRFFAWLALQNRCLTADRLARKGIDHDPLYKFCRLHPETAAHLFIACPVVSDICVYLLQLWSLPLVWCGSPGSSMLDHWGGCAEGISLAASRERLGTFLTLFWWIIWKERNARTFKSKSASKVTIIGRAMEEIAGWKFAGLKGALLIQ